MKTDLYPGRVFLHLVVVAVVSAGVTLPKAVLTELIVKTLLTAIAKARHALQATVRTCHRMKD